LNGKFCSYEFENLDQLLSVAERLPVAETIPLTRLAGARRWSNSSDYRVICTADHIWQVAGKNYRIVQHGDLVRTVVSQLAELGLDDTRGRLDAWNMQGQIWITALSPQEFPIAGDTYRDGVLFKNSLDGSSAVTAAYYAWRQVCENGLHAWTRELTARKIHTGTSSIRNWLRLAIRRIREQRPQFEQMIQRAAETRIEEEDVNAVLMRLNIGQKVSHKIVERLEHTSNLTRYDLANAITSYATHVLATRPLARERYEDAARRVMVTLTMPAIDQSETVK